MQEVHIDDGSDQSQIATLQREIWGLRDVAVSAMSENANLQLRLKIAQARIKQLEKVAAHRNQMLNSTTWKVGKLVLRPMSFMRRFISRTPKESKSTSG